MPRRLILKISCGGAVVGGAGVASVAERFMSCIFELHLLQPHWRRSSSTTFCSRNFQQDTKEYLNQRGT